MARRIAVIDADSHIYATACNAEIKVGENEWMPYLDEDTAMRNLLGEIEQLADTIDADDIFVCISDSGRNWRNLVLPSYKANRKTMRSPAMRSRLRQRLLEDDLSFTRLAIKWLEADDVCGISSTTLSKGGREAVIISQDKDMLTIPGLTWNPRPSSSGRKREIEEVSEYTADFNHLFQAICGDSVDNYKGCPGVGAVGALKLLNAYADKSPAERWNAYVELFTEKGLSAEDALVQARVARILRNTDWNAAKRKMLLWNPPVETSNV